MAIWLKPTITIKLFKRRKKKSCTYESHSQNTSLIRSPGLRNQLTAHLCDRPVRSHVRLLSQFVGIFLIAFSFIYLFFSPIVYLLNLQYLNLTCLAQWLCQVQLSLLIEGSPYLHASSTQDIVHQHKHQGLHQNVGCELNKMGVQSLLIKIQFEFHLVCKLAWYLEYYFFLSRKHHPKIQCCVKNLITTKMLTRQSFSYVFFNEIICNEVIRAA